MPRSLSDAELAATRQRLCCELAKLVYPEGDVFPYGEAMAVVLRIPNAAQNWRYFNPFGDREAAQTLVRWWKVNRPAVDLFRALVPLLYEGDPATGTAWRQSGVASRMLAFLLATPEQITIAACQALGLSLEDGK